MTERDRRRALTRRKLLETAVVAAPALLLARDARALADTADSAGALQRSASDFKGMNVVIFLTDQERAIQHFPKGWAARNLPGLTQLRRNGLEFTNCFTNACMCSPARSTLMSGYFPAQHQVKYTLEEDMPADEYPQFELPPHLPNIASVMSSAGYSVIYKGKWHCSKPPPGASAAPADLAEYGFARWNPPDAGANQTIPEAGGGSTNNDGRFMDSTGSAAAGHEGAIEYLTSIATQQQPFCLIVSLVNPHDVLFYPNDYKDAGYGNSSVKGTIKLPRTINEDLSTKPRVQREFQALLNGLGRLTNRQMERAYINFYGNLMKESDAYLVQVLNTLDKVSLREDTVVIRTADHGEMGLAHGGLRQKNFNFYEESTNVPLVYSNPKLFKRPRRSKALVSHVDFLPTLASLFGAPRSAQVDWEGVDYSRKVVKPNSKPPQNYVVFTYDDFQSGQANPPYPKPPNHIVSIREKRWKLAKYYDTSGKKRNEWEMYDLKRDPMERKNLADRGYKRTPLQQKEYRRLKRKLARVQKTRLAPL